MPFRVHSRAHPEIEIYWGFDKYENEELLKHFWDGDVWFHVDKYSSSHIYVRLGSKWTVDTMPETLIYEAAQITKAFSIEGSKHAGITIIYTPASNVTKDGCQEIGTVTFKNNKAIKRFTVEHADKELLKYFKHKTQRDESTDLRLAKLDHDKEQRASARAAQQQAEKQQREAEAEKKREKERLDPKNIFKDAPQINNEAQGDEDFW